MPICKKRIAAVLVAFIIMISGAFAVADFKNDVSAEQEIPARQLFYFSDYYPTLLPRYLNSELKSKFYFYYDTVYTDQNRLIEMYEQGFFRRPFLDVFVMDIKTFKPDSAILEMIFNDMKEYGCKHIILITLYPESEYSSLENIVDCFVQDDFSYLEWFMDGIFNLYTTANDGLEENIGFFLDEQLAGSIGYDGDLDALCEQSPFVRIFMEKLYEATGCLNVEEILSKYSNIKVFTLNIEAESSQHEIIDLLTNERYEFVEIRDFYDNLQNGAYECTLKELVAIAFIPMSQVFYDYLAVGQKMGFVNIYALITEPFVLGSGGLNVTTDVDLVPDVFITPAAQAVGNYLGSI